MEDQHGALDLRGIGRALLSDLRGGAVLQGGSTITQQYVKTVVTGDQVSLHRKLVEAAYATQLARHATKNQILAAYLNQVYFGEGVYGIATAAEHYFSAPVGHLDLAQAAALAGTLAGPARYRPTAGREALLRRNQVLGRMAAVGFVTPARAATAERQPMRTRVRAETVRFPYFVDYVTRQLLASHAFDATLGPAMVGGDYARSKVNLATGQGGAGGFPPGSSFKVFYLVAALEQGLTTATSFEAPPVITVRAPECPGGYTVHNAEPASLGRLDLARATAESANTYFAQLMVEVGSPAAIQVAKRMGITSELRDYCSLVLGSENVSPLELAGAYATLADGGVHCQPLAVTRVTGPDGRVLDAGKPSCQRALAPGVAAAATAILRGVVAPGGTGFRAAFGRPLAGKTGTTTGFRDAWFTGFTPQLATSVWVGDPARQVPMPDLFNGGPVYGGTFPALIFRQFMSGSLADQPVAGLPGRAPAAGPPGAAPTAGRAGAIRPHRHHHGRR
jgi:membrane peptidoglycan carboxypeptidase